MGSISHCDVKPAQLQPKKKPMAPDPDPAPAAGPQPLPIDDHDDLAAWLEHVMDLHSDEVDEDAGADVLDVAAEDAGAEDAGAESIAVDGGGVVEECACDESIGVEEADADEEEKEEEDQDEDGDQPIVSNTFLDLVQSIVSRAASVVKTSIASEQQQQQLHLVPSDGDISLVARRDNTEICFAVWTDRSVRQARMVRLDDQDRIISIVPYATPYMPPITDDIWELIVPITGNFVCVVCFHTFLF